MRISNRNDLRNWVKEKVNLSMDGVEDITDAIRDKVHPPWGQDWTEFLATLPEHLIDLLPETIP